MRLLNQSSEVDAMCDAIRSGSGDISVDTEFIREKTFFPALALIQVATEDEVWLLDPLALSPLDKMLF